MHESTDKDSCPQSMLKTEPLTPALAQWIWVDLFLLLCSGHFDGRSSTEIANREFVIHALDYYRALEEGEVTDVSTS